MSNQKPWHERIKLEPQFPFDVWETPMREFTLHWHELLEIAYVRSGGLVITVEGENYEVAEGDIVIINSGSIHGFSPTVSDNSLVLLQFGLEIFDQSLDLRDRVFQKSVFGKKTFVSTGDSDVHSRLEALISTMQQEYQERKEGFRLAIKAALYELALLLLREVPARQVRPGELKTRQLRNHTLERIFSFVHENFMDPLSLDQAAASVPLSKFYFSRYFKEQTGQSFHAYLARVRVSHAGESLVGTDLPITEIAYQSGFVSLKTFNRVFRTYTGSSPSQYRAQRNF